MQHSFFFYGRNETTPDRTWIGLYQLTGNNSDLQWIDAGTPFVYGNPATYQNWQSGEPDGDDDRCAHIRPDTGSTCF